MEVPFQITLSNIPPSKNSITLFVCPPKLCISIVFKDHCKSQEKLKAILMQNFGGRTKIIVVFLGVAYSVCSRDGSHVDVPIK